MAVPGLVVSSSQGFVDTQVHTRFGGPVLSGQIADSADASGPLPAPGAIMGVQSTASRTTQIISTGAAGRASFVYIPQSTATMVPDASAPAYTGVALSWDSANKTLEVYSTVTGAWMRLHSSSGAAIVFSSS